MRDTFTSTKSFLSLQTFYLYLYSIFNKMTKFIKKVFTQKRVSDLVRVVSDVNPKTYIGTLRGALGPPPWVPTQIAPKLELFRSGILHLRRSW